jgi:hypothetical protein
LKATIGGQGSFLWLNAPLKLLDFSEFVLVNDAIQVGLATKGVFSLDNLKEMELDTYTYLVSESREIVKKLYGESKEK